MCAIEINMYKGQHKQNFIRWKLIISTKVYDIKIIMVDHEKKAMEFMSQADKRLHSVGGLFGSLFGGSSKLDEAVELYAKAANSFKMAKNWEAAGDAFCKAASLEMKCKSAHLAAGQYADAANCYRKTDPDEAVKVLLKAIDIYTDMGRFRIAAKHHTTIAEIYEKESINIPKSISHYEKAADYYKGEESLSFTNKCLVKVAQYSAELEQYNRAISIYEKMAEYGMNNQLLRYGAKDYFFRAALCRLCVDAQDVSNAVRRYEQMFPAFADSREFCFIKQLISTCLDQDIDAFDAAIADFTRISSLDTWHRTLLQRVRKELDKNELDLK